ncbi:hypothetical protein [Marinimicrobium sp. LS-A18]|uniref:hypothetical protein n=1 Tax=Marinimicrobium sp. LS-A18 TaxID=1381596 RepID=UPI000462F341|nr:hypothetical protein [Marinimicrobium sp. LS-A18]
MTIVEFLNPVKKKSTKDICLAAMYFSQRYQEAESLTVEGLRALLKRAKIPRAAQLNLAATLAQSAPYVDTIGKDGKRFLWALTSTGESYVRELLELPAHDIEIENDVASLDELISTIGDKDVCDYLNEAVKCLQVNAIRASVVFLWSGAVKKIRDDVFACGAGSVNTALAKFDPKAKPIKKLDDLVLVKESTLLLVSQELGLFDKNQRSVLEDCLNLRNKCGHPGKYKAGPKKVSSFIEDLVSVVFK